MRITLITVDTTDQLESESDIHHRIGILVNEIHELIYSTRYNVRFVPYIPGAIRHRPEMLDAPRRAEIDQQISEKRAEVVSLQEKLYKLKVGRSEYHA